MIHFAEKDLMDFISWINATYPAPKPVYITVLHGYEMIEVGEEETADIFAFAAYKPGEKPIMLVPGEIPSDMPDNEIIYGGIAHEYKHHLQFCNNEPFDEEEANKFASEIARIWFSKKEDNNG